MYQGDTRKGSQLTTTQNPKEVVLVAWNEKGYSRVCICLFGLSEVED